MFSPVTNRSDQILIGVVVGERWKHVEELGELFVFDIASLFERIEHGHAPQLLTFANGLVILQEPIPWVV